MRQRRGQIDRRRGLSHAAFLICNRDDGSHAFLPPPAREQFSRREPGTAFLSLCVAFRKPPRPGLNGFAVLRSTNSTLSLSYESPATAGSSSLLGERRFVA